MDHKPSIGDPSVHSGHIPVTGKAAAGLCGGGEMLMAAMLYQQRGGNEVPIYSGAMPAIRIRLSGRHRVHPSGAGAAVETFGRRFERSRWAVMPAQFLRNGIDPSIPRP